MPRIRAAAVTGIKELDRALRKAFDGDNSEINKAFRTAMRAAMKKYVLPDVQQRVPVRSRPYPPSATRPGGGRGSVPRRYPGMLKAEVKPRAAKRSSKYFGIQVGWKEQLYQGDTYYGGFAEFGTKPRRTKKGAYRGRMPVFKMLRKPLYDNEQAVRREVIRLLSATVKRINSRHP